jgi:hypothetical protein
MRDHGWVKGGWVRHAIAAAILIMAESSCGGRIDDRFSDEAFDESTDPLTEEVIDGPTETAPDPPPSGFAFWHFDDCSPTSHVLADGTGGGADAHHAFGGACVPGIAGLGVQFRKNKDLVAIRDEPKFTVGPYVAVGAWIHPTAVSGDHPIIIKRRNDRTAFSLGIHKGNVEMAVVLTTGKRIVSRAPISAGTWSHVAGVYDGSSVSLFLNGEQVGRVAAAGTLRNVSAPIRIGATTQTQHFRGTIDDVFLSTFPLPKDQFDALSCVPRPSTIASVTPATSGPVSPGTTVHYDVTVYNNDIGGCRPVDYDMSFTFVDPNIMADPEFASRRGIAPGQVAVFGADITGNREADDGPRPLSFVVVKTEGRFQNIPGNVVYELIPPTGCFVRPMRELMITNPGVVDDPDRTTLAGAWTFGRLMREAAPTPEDAPAMTEQLFRTWVTDQTINGFTVPARPGIQKVVFDVWPRTDDGALDLERAPLRLQAIVNRIDLHDLDHGSAGEGRFVFAVNAADGSSQAFTVILEYDLPAETEEDVRDWAFRWHDLSSYPFPSEEYNAALEAITLRFSGRGAAPARTNGSALLRLRTNEIALLQVRSLLWELRQFALSPDTGFFAQTPVPQTPDLAFNRTPTLARFVDQNREAIVADRHSVPEQFENAPFLAGSALNNVLIWSAPGIDSEARFHLSLNTCNGCHGPDTQTNFLQIRPRSPGGEARLSPFLTGTTVLDRETDQPRTLNELARRKAGLTEMVCAAP